jgi:glycosyltransferase involved in cell wall biosynthesis
MDDMVLRILHIDSGPGWRGGQRQLYLLTLAQRTRGTEPLVVGQPRAPVVLRLRDAGVASAGVPMRGTWDITAFRKIRRLVRMWNPSVVHVHDLRALSLVRSALAGLPAVPLVVQCRAPSTRVNSLRVAATGPRAVRFIAPNASIAEFLAGLGIGGARVARVEAGVPPRGDITPRNWRREYDWPADALICGVLRPEAGVASIRAIVSRFDEPARKRIRLVILGGPTGRSTIAGTEAVGAGFVDEMAAAIAGFDILASLSGPEGMNTGVLDAMALGVPPVAYSGGGADEFIEHGRSGLVVQSGDAVAFAAALSSLAQDDVLRDTMTAFGPGRASRFSVDRMADSTESVYRSLAGFAPA